MPETNFRKTCTNCGGPLTGSKCHYCDHHHVVKYKKIPLFKDKRVWISAFSGSLFTFAALYLLPAGEAPELPLATNEPPNLPAPVLDQSTSVPEPPVFIFEPTEGQIPLGHTVHMDGGPGMMEVTLGTELSLVQISNQSFIRMPVTAKNISGQSGNFWPSAFNIFGPDGVGINWITLWDIEDNIALFPAVRNGVSQEGYMYIPYAGNGTYILENAFGRWEQEIDIVFTVEF